MNVDVELCSFFVSFYNAKKKEGIVFIPNIEVAKDVMGRLYKQYIHEGILIPIQDLMIEEKTELTDECRQVKGAFYTNESLTSSCMILHLIKFINNNS